jgi:hypothetical protein
VDLRNLHSQHARALGEMSDAASAEARLWAGECADYYATRIVAARSKLGAPVRSFGREPELSDSPR